MNSGRTVFAQIMDFLPMADSRKCVARYHGSYKVRRFSCLDQFLATAFVQLCYPEALRRIVSVDTKSGKRIVIITNNFALHAATIAALYRERFPDQLILFQI